MKHWSEQKTGFTPDQVPTGPDGPPIGTVSPQVERELSRPIGSAGHSERQLSGLFSQASSARFRRHSEAVVGQAGGVARRDTPFPPFLPVNP